MNSKNHKVLRVYRTKTQAKESYDKISRSYDYFAGVFEKKYRNIALEQFNIKRGEAVLEIGFGTGHCLKQMAESVGVNGRVYGIDISSGMLEVSKQRLEEAGMRGGHRGNALERSEARAPARVRKKLPISNRKYQFKIRTQVRQLQAGTAQKMSNWTYLDWPVPYLKVALVTLPCLSKFGLGVSR